MIGVIFYGPPAAGKDTVTAALTEICSGYRLFPRLKAGPGRTAGYRMTTPEAIDQLRRDGAVVWENSRYDSTYVVDRPHLEQMLSAGVVPVVHLGQLPGVDAVASAVPGARWLRVYLWCPRDVAAQRIAGRATGDDWARLQVWDATEPLQAADLTINTAEVAPASAAAAIHARVLAAPAG
ncbi:kinase [Prauserella coralliicola]|nr:kinase [Prauserella coralliicola]